MRPFLFVALTLGLLATALPVPVSSGPTDAVLDAACTAGRNLESTLPAAPEPVVDERCDDLAGPDCQPHETDIDGECVDMATDPEHCGAPYNAVPENAHCEDGAAVCDDGYGWADGQCVPLVTYYRDADGDSYGDPARPMDAVSRPEGHVANADDCDDARGDVYPGASEAPDGIDNDCNGVVDDGACPPHMVVIDGRCVDLATDPQHCGAPYNAVGPNEHCSGGMGVCNHGYDRASDGTCQPTQTWYADADGDQFGDAARPAQAAEQPPGYVANGDDCDDSDPHVHPAAAEVPDGRDNDCDGTID